MAAVLRNGSARERATEQVTEQDRDPPACRRRQLCPGHGRCRACSRHGASRPTSPRRVTRRDPTAAGRSPGIALQTSSGGRMENRIKECQLDLVADRTSAATMRANQLRLWFASFASVLLGALRRIGLAFTQFARASCGTIRLNLLKIGALVKISVRRVHLAMASACPYQHEFALAYALETVQNLGVITPPFETDGMPNAPRLRNPG